MKKFIINKINNEEMERRHCRITLQNIKLTDRTEHDTTQHSTPNLQINNTNPIAHPKQTSNIIGHDLYSDTFRNTFNYQHQSNNDNKTNDASETAISTVMTDTDVEVMHASEKNPIPMSASKVSLCTSVNKHDKTDSDQHLKDKSKQQYSCKNCPKSFKYKSKFENHRGDRG